MGFCCLPSLSDKVHEAPPTFATGSSIPTVTPYRPPPPVTQATPAFIPTAAPPPPPLSPYRPPLGVRPTTVALHAPSPPQMALTEDQIMFFAEHGYLHLRGVVPQWQIDAALQVIDAAYACGDHGYNDRNPWDVVPEFRNNVAKHKAVIAPLANTPLYAMVEQLIGAGDSWQPQLAQISLREPSDFLRGKGIKIDSRPDNNSWHIDGGSGKYASTGSPFTMLVGVCLSHGQQEDANHGQLLVWPGSHRILHAGVAERVRKNLITDGHSIFAGTKESRPKIGDPIRVLMSPGDAVIAHQRLGHAGGPNVGPRVRKNIYLRVHHRHHDKFLASGELLNGSVFTEYAGVQEVLRKRGISM